MNHTLCLALAHISHRALHEEGDEKVQAALNEAVARLTAAIDAEASARKEGDAREAEASTEPKETLPIMILYSILASRLRVEHLLCTLISRVSGREAGFST